MSNPIPPAGPGLPEASALATDTVIAPAPGRHGKKGKGGNPASLWTDAWHDLRRRPMFILSAIIILVLLIMSFWPSLFTSIDPFNARTCELATARQTPSPGHLFGRDNLGCDVYAKTIYGARNSIVIGVFTMVITTLVGGLLGIVAGYLSGMVDAVASRLTEIF